MRGTRAAPQRNGTVTADLDVEALTAVVIGALGGPHYQWHLDPESVDLDRAHDTLTIALDRALRP